MIKNGILVFMISALINWLSKKQAMIETSVFGAKFIALKQGIEVIQGI